MCRRPNEKGHTEGLVGFARRNFMVPIPEFDDFEEFNRKLAEDCRKDLERKLRGKTGTKAELLEEDRQAMLPIPDNRSRRGESPMGNPTACRWSDSIETTTACRPSTPIVN